MRYTRALNAAFLFLSTILLAATTTATTARADNDDADEDQATTRVARISLLRGDVSLERAGSTDWEQATLNLPLVEGDTLATARDARLEIQIDARNFVRVNGDSVLQVVTLRDEGIALSLNEGTATLRLARFDRNAEYFEIDAPKTTVTAEKQGLYRLDVGSDGGVRITVRDDGRARIYSETSGFTLRDGRSAQLFYDGSEAGDWELSSAPLLDDWDAWTNERESYLLARLRFDQRDRYYDQDVWGAEELDAYGDWAYADNYGWVWRPHSTYISSYADWSPYRYGHWRWCRPYGWTWVGDEPWGWAPYHYGRWVYYNNSWCWAPRGHGDNDGRSRWHPALVTFVFVHDSRRRDVACWYPLRYDQRDPHYWDGRPVPPSASDVDSNEWTRSQRTDPAYLRAVTTLPADEFNRYGVRGRPAPPDLAQQIVRTPPVRGSLPIVPADRGVKGRAGINVDGQIVVSPPAGIRPARPMPPERHTGAITRKPGVALDDELRRTRLYNGREPQPVERAGTDDDTRAKTNRTGAVARPAPPAAPRTRVEGRIDTGRVDNDGTTPAGRTIRPRDTNTQEESPPSPTDVNERPERTRRPMPPRRVDENRDERPPVERRSQPVERISPPSRPDPPKERPAPPAERERPVTRERTSQPPEPRTQPAPPREQPPAPRKETPPPAPRRETTPPSPAEPSRQRNAPARPEKVS